MKFISGLYTFSVGITDSTTNDAEKNRRKKILSAIPTRLTSVVLAFFLTQVLLV